MSRADYELEYEENFDGGVLDESHWLPQYLPHWTTPELSAARYRFADGALRLRIEQDQQPWCAPYDGVLKASVLQTGAFAGPVGSDIGQLRFNPELRVRRPVENRQLYTPQYGRFELRCKAIDDPRCMVALWMMGYEDAPERSGEITVCEIFGHSLEADSAAVGMGLHPFGDPAIREEWAAERLPIDAREFNTYAVEWKPESVAFFVNDEHVKTSQQSPNYPMQFMLAVYEFADPFGSSRPSQPYPKEFVVDSFRGYRPQP